MQLVIFSSSFFIFQDCFAIFLHKKKKLSHLHGSKLESLKQGGLVRFMGTLPHDPYSFPPSRGDPL